MMRSISVSQKNASCSLLPSLSSHPVVRKGVLRSSQDSGFCLKWKRSRHHHPVNVAMSEGVATLSKVDRLTAEMKSWTWRGHKIKYLILGQGPPLLLVHGFGGSILHFRSNIPVLAQTHTVYAVDLLGFGFSDKPPIDYSMEVWRDLIMDFSSQFISDSFILVGNSVGSLACLMTAVAIQERVHGLVLLNCAGGMNNKSQTDDWRILLAYPLFKIIDILFTIQPIANYLFKTYAARENVKNILQAVYKNQEAVDDELIDLIHQPSTDTGAQEVLISVITGPGGPKPQDLAPQLKCPLLILWGDSDPFTPFDGPVANFFKKQERFTFIPLADVGHCPHDDRPDIVHQHMLTWLQQVSY